MNITFFGVGYVGLVSGVCLAETGNNVTCYDIDEARVKRLKKGISPIFEPGLTELIASNLKKKRVIFTSDAREAIKNSSIYFIAVGTPSAEDGSTDLSYVKKCAEDIGKKVEHNNFTVVIKSTVSPGTSDLVKGIIEEEIKKRKKKLKFSMASNPEFLREGTSVSDFMNPDRIVIGVADQETADLMEAVYTSFEGITDIIYCDIRTAEVAKYAANAMLASRVSFMNEMSRVCDAVNGDIEVVKKVLGADSRIGNKFLSASLGYGGSCFPKDVKELIQNAKNLQVDPLLIEAIHKTNEVQKEHFYQKVKKVAENEQAKTIGLLGLAFKAGTDDVRESAATMLSKKLLAEGYRVIAYDPQAVEPFKREKVTGVVIAKDAKEVVEKAEVVVLVTEWPEFKKVIEDKANNGGIVVVDGKNMLDRSDLIRLNIKYYSVGRPEIIGDLYREKK